MGNVVFWGRGGNQVVSVLVLFYDQLSSNRTEVIFFSASIV